MFQRIKDIIDKGRTFLVTTHVDPDGDAVGSAFALCFALAGLGKDAAVYLQGPVPYRYRSLPRPAVVHHRLPGGTYDGVFVVDCGSLLRVGDAHESLKHKGFLINIDHHEANEAFGQINVIDERASSTAEILYLILKALDVRFTLDVAANLYVAVLTDTGSFRNGNTTERAFSICKEMISLGVSPASVAIKVYESHPKERLHLLCLVLATLETFHEDRIALAHVTGDMFAQTHTNAEYAEGFVDYLKEIDTVEVACLLRELAGGKYNVSMRSKNTVDVAAIARSLGGGGHRKAAGCTLEGDLNTVKNRVLGAFSL
jgi:phosphoesterase RecJ-like protein